MPVADWRPYMGGGGGGGKNEDNSYFKKCVWETINQR